MEYSGQQVNYVFAVLYYIAIAIEALECTRMIWHSLEWSGVHSITQDWMYGNDWID